MNNVTMKKYLEKDRLLVMVFSNMMVSSSHLDYGFNPNKAMGRRPGFSPWLV